MINNLYKLKKMNKTKSLRTIKIILPLMLAVGLFFLVSMSSAFQTGEKIKVTDDTPIFWEFVGPGMDLTDPQNYAPFPGDESHCDGNAEICVIEAPSDGEQTPKPDINSVVELENDLDHFQQTGEVRNESNAVWYKGER